MSAYVRCTVAELLLQSPSTLIGCLEQGYANDRFASQYTRQTISWSRMIPALRSVLQRLTELRSEANSWSVLLEYPLYRLRRRIDLIILAGSLVVVVEYKDRELEQGLTTEDRRQVEEYALDLRDFHAESRLRTIIPILWTNAELTEGTGPAAPSHSSIDRVVDVIQVGPQGLLNALLDIPGRSVQPCIDAAVWDSSPYRPVPNVIEAATSIFAGHDVREIAKADADNLKAAAKRLLELIKEARSRGQRYLLMLTGVPGSGKTLAGLDVVHSALSSGIEEDGDIVYLSGNTPLVTVLREALALDERSRRLHAGRNPRLADIRRDVRTRIQHINDFLQEYLYASSNNAPHEHVIVFDEAQRAWDAKHGREKFDREASEPTLLLQLMSRHSDWCVCVCLVGVGQEINAGEEGLFGWGDALRTLDPAQRRRWTVFAPAGVLGGGNSTSCLGAIPADLPHAVETELELRVPQRSYRSPSVAPWVDQVLAGNREQACELAKDMPEYPICLTRSLPAAKEWLRTLGRGERRYGLVASSGARRLRAEGLGVSLHASSGDEISHWYLKPRGDVRSSYALEVTANEYTCQGLELDFIGVCWDGDLVWDENEGKWLFRRFSGDDWQNLADEKRIRFLLNSYRVLLTRAREGVVIWVPPGDDLDKTRRPKLLDATAEFLQGCGVALVTSPEPVKLGSVYSVPAPAC